MMATSSTSLSSSAVAKTKALIKDFINELNNRTAEPTHLVKLSHLIIDLEKKAIAQGIVLKPLSIEIKKQEIKPHAVKIEKPKIGKVKPLKTKEKALKSKVQIKPIKTKEKILKSKVVQVEPKKESKEIKIPKEEIFENLANLYQALQEDNKILALKETPDADIEDRRKLSLSQLNAAIQRVKSLPSRDLTEIMKNGGRHKNWIFLPVILSDEPLGSESSGAIKHFTVSAEEAATGLSYLDLPIQEEEKSRTILADRVFLTDPATFLHLAIDANNLEAVKLLTQAGANPNIVYPSSHGRYRNAVFMKEYTSPLIRSFQGDYLTMPTYQIIEALVASGAKSNLFRKNSASILNSMIRRFTQYDYLIKDFLKLVLSAGARLDQVDGEGVAPLLLAAEKNHGLLVLLLKECIARKTPENIGILSSKSKSALQLILDNFGNKYGEITPPDNVALEAIALLLSLHPPLLNSSTLEKIYQILTYADPLHIGVIHCLRILRQLCPQNPQAKLSYAHNHPQITRFLSALEELHFQYEKYARRSHLSVIPHVPHRNHLQEIDQILRFKITMFDDFSAMAAVVLLREINKLVLAGLPNVTLINKARVILNNINYYLNNANVESAKILVLVNLIIGLGKITNQSEKKATIETETKESKISEEIIFETLTRLYRALETDNKMLTDKEDKEGKEIADPSARSEKRKMTLLELNTTIKILSNFPLTHLPEILKKGGKSAGKNSVTFIPIKISDEPTEIYNYSVTDLENGISQLILSPEEALPGLNYIDLPTQGGKTLLHLAIEAGNLEAVRLLLTEGKANPNIVLPYLDMDLNTSRQIVRYTSPLMMGYLRYSSWSTASDLKKSFYQMLEILVASGANANWSRRDDFSLLTRNILSCGSLEHPEIFRLFLKAGARLDYSDGLGNVPLLYAAQQPPFWKEPDESGNLYPISPPYALVLLLREYIARGSYENVEIVTSKNESALDLILKNFNRKISKDFATIVLEAILLLLTICPRFLNKSATVVNLVKALSAADPADKKVFYCVKKLQEICPHKEYLHNQPEWVQWVKSTEIYHAYHEKHSNSISSSSSQHAAVSKMGLLSDSSSMASQVIKTSAPTAAP